VLTPPGRRALICILAAAGLSILGACGSGTASLPPGSSTPSFGSAQYTYVHPGEVASYLLPIPSGARRVTPKGRIDGEGTAADDARDLGLSQAQVAAEEFVTSQGVTVKVILTRFASVGDAFKLLAVEKQTAAALVLPAAKLPVALAYGETASVAVHALTFEGDTLVEAIATVPGSDGSDSSTANTFLTQQYAALAPNA